jgi:hypothetical protein
MNHMKRRSDPRRSPVETAARKTPNPRWTGHVEALSDTLTRSRRQRLEDEAETPRTGIDQRRQH